MFGNKTNTTTSPATNTDSTTPKKPSGGVTYDLCRRVMKDGKEKLENVGRVFIRDSGTGGVVFSRDGEEFPILARKAKPSAPKQEAAPAPAAEAA